MLKTPKISDKFVDWNVRHVVFDSPTKARIYYKDGTVLLFVWDHKMNDWVNFVNTDKKPEFSLKSP